MNTLAAEPVDGQQDALGNPLLNLAIFGLFVAVTLVFVYRASRSNRTATDYYAAGRSFTGPQNGIAIAGDFLSAASFLGIAGAIAVNGYDGFLYSIGFLVALLLVMLVIAEVLRNVGKYTMGDVLAFRMKERPVRAAAATSTLVVCFFYLLAQMAGAGGLIALLLNIPVTDRWGQGMAIAAVGVLMIVYVLVGGMKGTTYIQIVKAALLLVVAAILAAWMMGRTGFNLSRLLGSAADASPKGELILRPGAEYHNPLDFVSLALALLLGMSGLPHVLMRLYTVPDGREARRSVAWAVWAIGVFYLFTLVIGYGAAAVLPAGWVTAANQNNAAPLLAAYLGGNLMLGLVSAVAFATILAVVAGLTITASASFAHDVYANLIKRGHARPDDEVRVARFTGLGIGLLAIIGGTLASGQNVAFLVALAFAIAASANLPTTLYTLFWRKFNTTGALFSIYGGLISSIVLILFSPVVSGKPVPTGAARSSSMIQGVDFHWFPLENPGLVSIPLSFLLGIVGTYVGRRNASEAPFEEERYAEMEIRALTGAGAEGATRQAPPAEPTTPQRPERPSAFDTSHYRPVSQK